MYSGLYAVKLTGTTAGGGSFTATHTTGVSGFLYAVEWIDGTFSDGVGAVLSVTNTYSGVNKTLLTLTAANDDKWYFPRELEQGNTGSDLATYTRSVIDGVLSLVVSGGGGTKTGGCIVYYTCEAL